MKKQNWLFLIVFGWILAGCSVEPTEIPELLMEPEVSHVVPVEQALGELDAVLSAIDGPETRSGGKRRVKSVEAVQAAEILPAVTRNAALDVEDLFYLVNFEGEEGYALLGADDRLEPVYAVMDQGNITLEEMQYAATATPEQAAADGVLVTPLQMIIQAAGNGLLGGIGGIGGGTGGLPGTIGDIGLGDGLPHKVIRREYGPWETAELQPRLMKTNWDQNSPYNLLCPKRSGEYCVAGCVPVALAQIAIYHAMRTGRKIPGVAYYNFNEYRLETIHFDDSLWNCLKEAVQYPSSVKEPEPGTDMTLETYAVARFINAVGRAVYADYGVGGTYASDDDAAEFLRLLQSNGLGYKNIRLGSINLEKAREMVYLKKLPVYYSGRSASDKSGHAFVFEGWLRQKQLLTLHYDNAPSQSGYQYRSYVYVNMGWGDDFWNGYYVFNVFTTSDGAEYPETRAGASLSSKSENDYVQDFAAITYDMNL